MAVAVLSSGVARTNFSHRAQQPGTYKLASTRIVGSFSFSPFAPTSYVRARHRCIPNLLPPTHARSRFASPTTQAASPRTMATLSAQRKHKVTVVGSGNWYVVTPSAQRVPAYSSAE